VRSVRSRIQSLAALSALPAILLGLLVFPAGARDDEIVDQRRVPIHALLIGCARYPKLQERNRRREPGVPNPRLQGPERDVELMRDTLVGLGVDATRIRVLTTRPGTPDAQLPTRANIVRELDALPARVGAGQEAQVLVLYAGHGTQQWDAEEEGEVDRLDEAWCPMDTDLVTEDGARTWTNLLLDDEIGARLRRVRATGALVWMIMDCCHAGTGVRGKEAATRGLPASSPPPSASAAAKRAALWAVENLPYGGEEDSLEGIVAFYGSRSFEKLREVRIPDEAGRLVWHGPLTVSVARALTSAGDHLPDLTFSELHDAVLHAYRGLGRLTTARPQAEGALNRRVFRAGAVHAPRIRLRRRPDGRLSIDAGAIRGIRPGSELTIYASGLRGRADGQVGFVRVRQVLAGESLCEPAPGSDGAWAVPREGQAGVWDAELTGPVVGPGALRLALVDAAGESATVASLPPAFWPLFAGGDASGAELRARFTLVAGPEDADWLLLLDTDGVPSHLRRRGAGSDPLPIRARQDGARVVREDVEHRLWSIFRAETLLDLQGENVLPRLPSDPPVLELSVQVLLPNGELREVENGASVAPGSVVRLELAVRAAETQQEGLEDAYDVYVFRLDPQYEFVQLYPRGTLTTGITRERARTIPLYSGQVKDTMLTDESLGLEHLLLFARPQVGARGAPLDLAFLADPPEKARAGGAKGLGSHAARQLHALAFGRRAKGAERWEEDEQASETLMLGVRRWHTAWGALQVPPLEPDAPSVRLERPPDNEGLPRPSTAPRVWSFGPELRLARAGDRADAAWRVLVAEGDGATHVLVDLDALEANEAPPSAAGLARLVERRSFDAELAYRLESDGTCVVWYDTDDDGRMDLVLVDTDGDRRADRIHRRRGKIWSRPQDTDQALLQTTRLTYLSGRPDAGIAALRILRSLTTAH